MVPKLRNFLYMHVGPKKAQNVILYTKSMQIEFFHFSSYKYAYFYSQWLKLFFLALLCFKKCLRQISPEKKTKTKGRKKKNTLKKFIKQ